jgi:hypothetical protein
MQTSDSLSVQYESVRIAAEGHFAIAAVLLTMLAALAGFAAGRKAGWW